MFQARFSAVYTPEGGDPLRLIDAHRTWMTSEAESEWDLPMDEREFCSADYKEFVPTGNASKSFSWEWFVQYLSVAQLESNLRRLELSLALARTGKLAKLGTTDAPPASPLGAPSSPRSTCASCARMKRMLSPTTNFSTPCSAKLSAPSPSPSNAPPLNCR